MSTLDGTSSVLAAVRSAAGGGAPSLCSTLSPIIRLALFPFQPADLMRRCSSRCPPSSTRLTELETTARRWSNARFVCRSLRRVRGEDYCLSVIIVFMWIVLICGSILTLLAPSAVPPSTETIFRRNPSKIRRLKMWSWT
uniref:Uncharacterized protein n=1 Tax=Opuntia streptacantha TaxID=393608 RepID=A0A7C9A693_OPUST